MIEITLPWPTSVNHYKKVGRTIATKSGKMYQTRINTQTTKNFYYEVWLKIRSYMALKRMTEPLDSTIDLALYVDLYPPDKRRRDIDNCLKVLCDSLVHGGLIKDDSQISRLVVQRCGIIDAGQVIVKIEEIA